MNDLNMKSSTTMGLNIAMWVPLVLPPLFWAGNFVAGRAVRDDVPPMTLAFSRHMLALLCLLPFCWGSLRSEAHRYWEIRWQLARVALTGLGGFNLFIYLGLHSTTAANGLLLNSTIPVLIVLIGAGLYGQKLRIQQAAGMAVSCLGVLAIIMQGDVDRLVRMQFSHGDLIVFIGMICFALYTHWLRAIPADLNRVGLLGAQLLIASIALLPFFGWEFMTGQRANWNIGSMVATFYVAIVASLGATLLYMTGVSRVGAARAGLFIHLIPIYGAILSTVFLGETVHLYHALGFTAILAGLAISNWQRAQNPHQSLNNSASM
ncbi:DMT family transporter [Pseudomonas palleroniana]|uniref:DMT family transporter n=2 Tax=Bacteria TaxID=2 RepID=UPI0018E6AEBB|nr:DMT family transporter [Pseudomonas palleroniana]MBI6906802.1 DMT family transporter [Pseudomonas palleroniana]